jgi:adenylate cyclase
MNFWTGERVGRHLAAILAADIAGYARLMSEDEEATLAGLRAWRHQVADPLIRERRGRIIKSTGDGFLVEFQSIVDAVRCAVEMQREMAERNADISAERRIEFRIGVNLGDIVAEDHDIFGDGVNVAGFASRAWCATRFATSCLMLSRIGASSRSRTSPGRCVSTR